MYVGSLFSGIGGIELGFEKAGFETRWFIEKDGSVHLRGVHYRVFK